MKEILRFFQLSDLHLDPDPTYVADGYQPYTSFLRVLKHVQEADPAPDFLLLTGDLAWNQQREVYPLLDKLLSGTQLPYYWIPGNHDHPGIMQELAPQLQVQPERFFTRKGIAFVLLDSLEPNYQASYGQVSSEELAFMEQCLQENPNYPTAVVLHHQPILQACPWIDRVMLREAEVFINTLEKYPQVQAVLFGHIHNPTEKQIRGIRYWAAPSTAYQFKFGPQFSYDPIEPGYREVLVHPDGSWNTQILRVPQQENDA